VVGAAIVVRRLYRPRFQPDRARLQALLARGLPFGAAMAAGGAVHAVGVLMLGAFATAADVACFNVGYLLSQPFGFVASAVTLGAFPRLARRARGDRPGAARRPAAHVPLRAAGGAAALGGPGAARAGR
jgi:O-antigen/teichoic acid export membrane protein